jgi:hypothetical protein
MSRLTAAQQRILAEVRADGERVYNGRARRTIEALEKAGLVTVEWDTAPHAKDSGMELTERITVRPAPAHPVEDTLAFLMALLPDLQGLTSARLELSIEDGRVTAQIMADRIAVPLVGAGEDAPAALGELVEAVEQAAKEGRRRRRAKRTRQ